MCIAEALRLPERCAFLSLQGQEVTGPEEQTQRLEQMIDALEPEQPPAGWSAGPGFGAAALQALAVGAVLLAVRTCPPSPSRSSSSRSGP